MKKRLYQLYALMITAILSMGYVIGEEVANQSVALKEGSHVVVHSQLSPVDIIPVEIWLEVSRHLSFRTQLKLGNTNSVFRDSVEFWNVIRKSLILSIIPNDSRRFSSSSSLRGDTFKQGIFSMKRYLMENGHHWHYEKGAFFPSSQEAMDYLNLHASGGDEESKRAIEFINDPKKYPEDLSDLFYGFLDHRCAIGDRFCQFLLCQIQRHTYLPTTPYFSKRWFFVFYNHVMGL